VLPNSYVLPAAGAVSVFRYGTKGDGTTLDLAAIQSAAAALTPGQTLFFPSTGSSYFIGPTTIDLPAGCGLHGVAGPAPIAPARSTLTGSGLALCGDWNGQLSATQGYVFDAGGGRLLYTEGPQGGSVYAGPALPGRGANEYLLILERTAGIGTAWTDNGFATVEESDYVVVAPAGETYLDPSAVILPNGHILVACMHIAPNAMPANPGSIATFLSTDGGRTWVARAEIKPVAAPHKYAEPCMIRARQPIPNGANRVFLAFMDLYTDGSADTVFQIVHSDSEFVSYTMLGNPSTPVSGPSSAGRLQDSARAGIYEIADGPLAGQLGIVYTRRVQPNPVVPPGVPAEIWSQQLDNVGNIPSGTAAVKLTTVPGQAGLGTSAYAVAELVGCNPIVTRLRTGEYGLYFTECDFDLTLKSGGTQYSVGGLHFMSCPPSAHGDPTKFVNDRLVSITNNAGGGYGRAWPLPKPNGEIELIMTEAAAGVSANLVSVIHYGGA